MKRRFMNKVKMGMAVALMALLVWGYGFEARSAGKDTAAADMKYQMVLPNFSALAKQVQPGVVNIRTVKTTKEGGPVFRHFFGNRDPFGEGGPGREFKRSSLGSGFIIDREGVIVTNNHVVENADQIKVRLSDEREIDAKIIGRDPKTDLASPMPPPAQARCPFAPW